MKSLAEELAAKGLTTRATPNIPSKPIDGKALNNLLSRPKTFDSERIALMREKDKIERKQKKLLETYYADAISIDLFKAEQKQLSNALSATEWQIAAHETNASMVNVLIRTSW
jgi:hypothetical protein